MARRNGAQVWAAAEIRPEFGAYHGKGEAVWKSLFVATGDILVFLDGDLTEWGSHFVSRARRAVAVGGASSSWLRVSMTGSLPATTAMPPKRGRKAVE